jgi:hypothetical protein
MCRITVDTLAVAVLDAAAREHQGIGHERALARTTEHVELGVGVVVEARPQHDHRRGGADRWGRRGTHGGGPITPGRLPLLSSAMVRIFVSQGCIDRWLGLGGLVLDGDLMRFTARRASPSVA